MKKYIKTLWHEWWFKHYHLPRSVRGMKIVDVKITWKNQVYHDHQFGRVYYHGMEYQKLDPVGMKKFSDSCIESAFGSKVKYSLQDSCEK
jgi:hypothetical protein